MSGFVGARRLRPPGGTPLMPIAAVWVGRPESRPCGVRRQVLSVCGSHEGTVTTAAHTITTWPDRGQRVPEAVGWTP